MLTVAQQSAKELHKELSGEYKDSLEIGIGTHWELYKYDNQASHEASLHLFWFLWKNGDTFF